MVEDFLALSNKHKNRVCGCILDASFLKEGGKEWRSTFSEKIPNTAGGLKRIYTNLSKLTDEGFERLVEVMTEEESG